MNDFEAALDARNRPRRGQLLREWITLLPKDKADMLHEALSDRRYGTSLIVRVMQGWAKELDLPMPPGNKAVDGYITVEQLR